MERGWPGAAESGNPACRIAARLRCSRENQERLPLFPGQSGQTILDTHHSQLTTAAGRGCTMMPSDAFHPEAPESIYPIDPEQVAELDAMQQDRLLTASIGAW
uniref:Uncharacterized protein n=1 Tax=Thermogemmatispora argillosa TaxID=2045280 RepID=A0A455SXB0_9CHLR|nr:hypothetical protein KTA_04050 [Thermogemmatispora argillosa]